MFVGLRLYKKLRTIEKRLYQVVTKHYDRAYFNPTNHKAKTVKSDRHSMVQKHFDVIGSVFISEPLINEKICFEYAVS